MAKHTIKLKKYSDNIVEYAVAAAITPGMIVELTSAGKVQAHSGAGQNVAPIMVALEDELQGKSINDAYAADDKAQIWIPYRGDEIYGILADGENIAIGDLVESNGDGKLKKHVADQESWESATPSFNIAVYPNQIVGQALEAIDISDSSGAESSGDLGYDKRIKIRIV